MSKEIKIVIKNNQLPEEIDFRSGILMLVDKPLEWTSFDVVNKLRYRIGQRHGTKKFKVGHAGTLDPRATGLLLIAVGKYTKLIDQLQGLGKSYVADIRLGATTASYDAEQPIDENFPVDHITLDKIKEVIKSYTGDIMQAPPMFSAIKVDGQRLYKKARKGQLVEVKKRPVTISKLDILDWCSPDLRLECTVSKGTYIRSLAHDIGKSLDSGGYLTGLVRTSVSGYSLKHALSVDEAVMWIDQVRLSGTSLL